MVYKAYSGMKIFWHPEKIKSFKKGEIAAPVYIRIKPTNRCNHNCFYCSYSPDALDIRNVNRADEIPYEKMMEILSNLKEMGVKAVTYSGGGEPLIYTHITETLKKTLECGIDLSIITNGQELKGEKAELLAKAKWVRISADSCNAKIFAETRRVPEDWFYKLEENIRNFAEIKDEECEFGINYVINHLNAETVYESAKYFKELGVNHVKFSARWDPENFEKYHAPFKEKVLEQLKKVDELQDENFKIHKTYEYDFEFSSIRERACEKCFVMQTTPVIGADCNVYFCHDKAYSDDGKLGSIKDISFKELWFSNKAKEIFDNFKPKEQCKHHCTYDGKNMLIQQIIDSHGRHMNFV